MHIDLNGVGTDFFAPFAQMIDDLILADHTAAAREQYFKQSDLPCRKLERLVIDQSHAPVLVEHQPAMTQDRRPAARAIRAIRRPRHGG